MCIRDSFYPLIPLPEPTLDVGCGDGHFAAMTFPNRALTAGIDPWWGPVSYTHLTLPTSDLV